MLVHFFNNGLNAKSLKTIGLFWTKFFNNPLYLYDSYVFWWSSFVENCHSGNFNWTMFVPLMTPLLLFAYLLWCYIRSTYSFGLWYFFNNRFAKLKDVERMGLLNGTFAILGKINGKILSLNKPSNVLCFGNEGSGKTSCVAIPSILRSDNCSIVALDNSGLIADYTSGYRSKLGPVFYFNWDKVDNHEKGEYYARWNPLSSDNMPVDTKKRELYLQKIVRHLFGNDDNNLENYWTSLTANLVYLLLLFYMCKISQAEANDYFLNIILEKGRLKQDDKDLLSLYYKSMHPQYTLSALQNMQKNVMNVDDYMPIGSWSGIPEIWQGKDANLIMFADWIKFIFDMPENGDVFYNEDWKNIIDSMKNEVMFFGYNLNILKGLQKFEHLSKQQIAEIFKRLFELIKVFENPTIREKLSSSDFCTQIIYGQKKNDEKRIKPVTVYCVSEGFAGKLLSALFIDLVMETTLDNKQNNNLPIMLVLDDLGQNNKISALPNMLVKGKKNSISSLMLGNKLKDLEKIYGMDGLEQIVCNANYKVLLADDDKTLSIKLENLAGYGYKSVQIPAVKVGAFLGVKQGLADAHYYRKIAKNVVSKRDIITRGYQLILAEGFYHQPILAHSVLFIRDDLLKKKSNLKPEYFLADKIRHKRNIQDTDAPVDVIKENSVTETNNSTLSIDEQINKSPEKLNNNDWWMDEDAFSANVQTQSINPFEKK